MTRVYRFGLVDFILFLLVLAAAGGARAWYVSACCGQGTTDGPLQVQEPRKDQGTVPAAPAAEGEGAPAANPAETVSRTAPLYPWLMSLLGRASADAADTDRLARWIQCGLGALTAGLYFFFACRAFASRCVGLVTGVMAAVYPFWVVNTAEINDGVLVTFLLALALFLGGRGNQRGGYLPSWLYGLALAGLGLTRAALWPFAWVALLWYLLRCGAFPRGWFCAFLAFLGFLTGIVPAAIRGYRDSHEFFPPADAAYVHLWEGNNPEATGGPWTGEPPAKPGRQLAIEVGDEITNNLAGTLQRRLRAGVDFFFGEDWFTNQRLWREGGAGSAETAVPDWLRRSSPSILFGSLLGLLVLAVLGWRWSWDWRQHSRPLAMAAFWIPLPYILTHGEALQGPRLPLDGVLICFAAYALVSFALFRVWKAPELPPEPRP